MQYPLELLPQSSYKLIEFSSPECINAFIHLIRETSTKEIIDEYGRLKAEYVTLQTDHLKDYSTNLLGIYKPQHCAISWIMEHREIENLFELWNPNDKTINPPLVNQHFNLNTKKGHFYLNLVSFLNKEIASKDNKTFKSKVIHTPTTSNFWHCSIRWYVEGKDSIDLSKSERRKYLSLAKVEIIEKALIEEPAFQSIPASCYTQFSS